MIFSPDRYHDQLPLPATGKWKDGVWDVWAFRHRSMSLLYFAPRHTDYQTPHYQDEWYFILEGSGVIEIEGERHSFAPGSAIFVGAGQRHQFVGDLVGIRRWAVFYGPKGGENSD